jgi:two-component system, NtrC family, response regulator HydG
MENPTYFILYRRDDGVEKVYHLTGTLVVGRSTRCQISLGDEGVSREHCSLRSTRGGVTVTDRDSTNGTYINGSKIREAVARPGDRIVVGQACLILCENDPARTAAGLVDGAGAQTGVLGDTTVEVVLKAASEKVPDATLFHESGVSGDAFRALFAVTDLVSSGTEREKVLEEFLAVVMDLYDMDLGAVFLADQAGGDPQSICESKRAGAGGYAPSLSVLRRVIAGNVSVVASDPLSDPRFAKARSIASAGTTRILCVPIRSAGAVTGAVYLSSRKTVGSVGRPGEKALHVLVALTSQVTQAVENLDYRKRLERDNRVLRFEIAGTTELVGDSVAMEDVRTLVRKVASTEATVLITGESGTGKELVAAALHTNSSRGERPMISINCGAIPDSMVESELFGHEKGAFTGAMERKAGRFELAHGGTLFLDEVGELPLALQVKLLRVLEEKCFYRVGGQELVHVDVRIVAATNADLDKKVEQGTFREDLFYRLQVFRIHAPPLREHLEDIPLLASHLLNRLAGKSVFPADGGIVLAPEGTVIVPDGIKRLKAYSWPGNVRELRNTIEREMILSDGGPLTFDDFRKGPGAGPGSSGGKETVRLGSEVNLSAVVGAHIAGVLRLTRWNKKLAAEILGISRPTLYDKIKQYGIEKDEQDG